jgi:hypothetical protein
MFPGFGSEGRPVKIAQCLRALKLGMDDLKKFWYFAQLQYCSALTRCIKAGSWDHQD